MQHHFKSVFVVDDDRFHLEIMKQILSEAGINNITCFESGVDCLDRIHQKPDVIFRPSDGYLYRPGNPPKNQTLQSQYICGNGFCSGKY